MKVALLDDQKLSLYLFSANICLTNLITLFGICFMIQLSCIQSKIKVCDYQHLIKINTTNQIILLKIIITFIS